MLLGLSGGVDSSVAAALIHRAIGERLKCVFVDNGLLRAGERERMENVFAGRLGIALTVSRRLGSVSRRASPDVLDPEQKRRIIGHTFIDVFETEDCGAAARSSSGRARSIPTSSSRSRSRDRRPSSRAIIMSADLPERMRLELIEPLRELFKDEVRELGRELGLPSEIVDREPFPGPGLAVRIVGEVTRDRVELLRRADLDRDGRICRRRVSAGICGRRSRCCCRSRRWA